MKKETIDLLLTNVDFLDENWDMIYGKEIAVKDGVIADIREHGTVSYTHLTLPTKA